MRFAFWPSNTGSWEDLVDLCTHAEATGWDGIYYADHFMPNQADTSGPTNECWTTLGALAVAVPRLRLGALVTGNTYRHPAVLAKMAANVDLISGGRLVFGLGAGWQQNEHEAYGLEFSTVGGRLSRLEEACQVVKGLLGDEQTTFEGRYYQLKEAPLAPKPAGALPLLIGGGGEKRTMRIAAQYADEWNVWGRPDVLEHKIGVLEQHCADLGRDPKAIKRSCQALTFVTTDEAMLERAKSMPMAAIAGSPDDVAATMKEYQAAGVDEFIFPGFAIGRGDRAKAAMDTFINEVAPAVR